MQTAREMAELALRIAAGLHSEEIKSFMWRGTAVPGLHQVTLTLSDGSEKVYQVMEVREVGGDSSGVSS